jgi:peroxiredoxin
MHLRQLFAFGIFPLAALLVRAELAPSPAEAKPLPVGARMPAAMVRALDGSPTDLAKETGGRLTLLVFYRGSWCPYCNRHLAALQEIEPELLKLGFQVIALSPDEAAGLRAMTDKNHLNYRLFSDHDMRAAMAFGLAFRVDPQTVEKYREYKIDLPPVPGEPAARWLPVPAAYLIGRDGTVKFAYANADYKTRVNPEELLAAAGRAASR